MKLSIHLFTCCLTLFTALPASAQARRPAGAPGEGGRAGVTAGAPGFPTKPGGTGSFIPDPNQGGNADSVLLLQAAWGRLVDVHGLVHGGEVSRRPLFRDFVIDESIQSDGVNYRLETNPITQVTRLVVLRSLPDPEFKTLLQQTQGLAPILPKAETAPPPFSFLARNATLVLFFDDLLEDGPAAAAELAETVRLVTGYPPALPFQARLRFDPNHGGIAGGAFHSTRVLVDMTVSPFEQQTVPLPVNALGLPASDPTSNLPNVSLLIPTRTDPASGQFSVLTNLQGAALSATRNGPVNSGSPTMEVVRAMRSGNSIDLNNGFVLDLEAPEVVGSWPFVMNEAMPDPDGRFGSDFLLDLSFTGPCRTAPAPGQIVTIGATALQVTEVAGPPDPGGRVMDVHARALVPAVIEDPALLMGGGAFLATYDPAGAVGAVPLGCWVSFSPSPALPPAAGVATTAQVVARFSEPMDPGTVGPFDEFRVVAGDAATPASSSNTVVGIVQPSVDLRSHAFSPVLPLAHASGSAETYHVELVGPRDLAGNDLLNTLPFVEFTLDPGEPTQANGGVVMRFADVDELAPIGLPDVRGQVFYDLEDGLLRGRPVVHGCAPIDPSNPVRSLMIPFPQGVGSPLLPFGSKVQSLWRYADAGWAVEDETKHNVDVEGLSWAPAFGQVVFDFFPGFEIRLSHSERLPDESLDNFLLPKYPDSGLHDPPAPFTDNVLGGPAAQEVVHPRALGYFVDPADLYQGCNGTPLMPFPLNRVGAPLVTYTWRDTAVLGEGGDDGSGIPLDVEVGAPLFLDPGPPGRIAPAGQVPTIGLPLLMEYRCYPTASGLGLNSLSVALAINSSARPTFRAFSSGGVNSMGQVVAKDPDLEPIPTGGFNPSSSPPGLGTQPTDNLTYRGQLDYVVKVSRAHTAWIDTGVAGPDYLNALVEGDFPPGTQVALDYRGADGFASGTGNAAFDATQLDPYGDVLTGAVNFFGGVATWSGSIDAVDGARYLQIRLSFLNDVPTASTPVLDSIGVAFLDS